MCVTDHLNLTGANPLRGPNDERLGTRFPDLTGVYSPRLRDVAWLEPWTPPAMLLWWAPYEEAPSGAAPAHLLPWTAPVELATAGAPADLPIFDRCRLKRVGPGKLARIGKRIRAAQVCSQYGVRSARSGLR